MDDVLLSFTTDEPCHDEETLALGGSDTAEIASLAQQGLIESCGSGWILTAYGDARRKELCCDCGLPWYALKPFDAATSLENLRLRLLLDRDVTGQWAVKEFSYAETFPYLPPLDDSELFALNGPTLSYLWPSAEKVRSFIDAFPRWNGIDARPQPPQECDVAQWCAQQNVVIQQLPVDVTLRNWYDFQHYCSMPPVPGDGQKFTNNDRFFFKRFNGNLPQLLSWLGRLHLVLLYQRHVANPGWFDFDQADQWNINAAVVVAETEEETRNLCDSLAVWHDELIGPANPLFLSAVSLEGLRTKRRASETICDWLAEKTTNIARPDRMENSQKEEK